MFLNFFLFFSNMMYVSFAMVYLRNLYLNLEDIKEISKDIKEKKVNRGKTYEEQLAYISTFQEKDRHEFVLFGWKVVMFATVITMAIFINKAAPLMIFNFRMGFFSIMASMMILGYLNILLLKKIGVRM